MIPDDEGATPYGTQIRVCLKEKGNRKRKLKLRLKYKPIKSYSRKILSHNPGWLITFTL